MKKLEIFNIIYFRGTQSPITFHVKENLVGAMIGQIFNMNSSSVATNKTANIRYIIANQQDVSDDIAIGKVSHCE